MKVFLACLSVFFIMGCAYPTHQNLNNASNNDKLEASSRDVDEKENPDKKQNAPHLYDVSLFDNSVEPCYNLIPADQLSAEYMKKINQND